MSSTIECGSTLDNDEIATPSPRSTPPYPRPLHPLKVGVSVELCPKCLQPFPVPELVAHWEACTAPLTHTPLTHTPLKHTPLTHTPRTHTGTGTHCTVKALATPKDVSVSAATDVELCPTCNQLFPISELVVHWETCSEPGTDSGARSPRAMCGRDVAGSSSTVPLPEERRVYDLEPHIPTVASAGVELELCVYCLKDIPLAELVSHSYSCSMWEESKV